MRAAEKTIFFQLISATEAARGHLLLYTDIAVFPYKLDLVLYLEHTSRRYCQVTVVFSILVAEPFLTIFLLAVLTFSGCQYPDDEIRGAGYFEGSILPEAGQTSNPMVTLTRVRGIVSQKVPPEPSEHSPQLAQSASSDRLGLVSEAIHI